MMKNKQSFFMCFFISIFLITNLFVPLSVSAEADVRGPQSKEELQKFVDTYFQNNLNKKNVPGAIVTIVKNGEVLLSKGYGYADLDQKTPATDKSVFRIGSISKSFTATAAMQLVEQGKLDLHKDINQYLSSYQIKKTFDKPITLHHLLTHTSGLDAQTYAITTQDIKMKETMAQYLSHNLPKRILSPGVEAQYSNYGFGIIGNLVEERSGMSFEDYMQKHIFQPLGMGKSSFDLKNNIAPDLATSYQYVNGKYQPYPYDYVQLSAAGELNTTAPDMANFMIAHLQNGLFQDKQILSEETAKLMHSKHFTKHPKMPGIAYGFFESYQNDLPAIMHQGTISGFSSEMYLIPDEQLGILVSANSTQGRSLYEGFRTEFLDHYYPMKNQANPIKEKTALPELKLFEGNYNDNINPLHGYGKWISFLKPPLNISILDNGNLTLKWAAFEKEKEFAEISPRYFQEVNGNERIHLFQAKDGKQQLVLGYLPYATFEKLPWYSGVHSIFLFGVPILFVLVSLIFLINWFIRRKRKVADHTYTVKFRKMFFAIAVFNIAFFLITMPFLGEAIVYGLPSWYTDIVCSIPFGTFLLGLWLSWILWKLYKEKVGSWWTKLSYFILVLCSLGYPMFLFYWNFLSVHFS